MVNAMSNKTSSHKSFLMVEWFACVLFDDGKCYVPVVTGPVGYDKCYCILQLLGEEPKSRKNVQKTRENCVLFRFGVGCLFEILFVQLGLVCDKDVECLKWRKSKERKTMFCSKLFGCKARLINILLQSPTSPT